MGRASSVPLGTARPASAALATAEQPEQGLPPTAALIGRSGGSRRTYGLRRPRRRARRLWWRVRLPVGACPHRLGGEPRLGSPGVGGRRRRGPPPPAGRGLRRSPWLPSTGWLGRELVLGPGPGGALFPFLHHPARA